MRTTEFAIDEFYHVYNRGTDKRNIFSDKFDLGRFFQSMQEFNVVEPIGSIYENFLRQKENGHPMSTSTDKKLVNIVSYCLNPNHYHFILEPLVDDGIVKFMQRIGNGYTKYFNSKYLRSGVLFQGKYKSVHIDSNEYLLYLSAYVNLNNRVHKLPPGQSLWKSSMDEYIDIRLPGICSKDIILGQFASGKEYVNFSQESLSMILENKDLNKFLLDK